MKNFENMDGMEVLWYLLTNWEEGRGLWMIIGFGLTIFAISLIIDYMDKKNNTKSDWRIKYDGEI
tara:strand:- start:51245 stop:51439 length:195 start_codon:yes stop_codon:yes gene_type:complete